MSEKITAEVWIAMDKNRDYCVGVDQSGAIEAYENYFQSSIAGVRLVCLNVSMTPPEDTSIDIDIPDEAGMIVDAEVGEKVEERR